MKYILADLFICIHTTICRSENGAIGLLHVKEQFRSRGFGEYLVRLFARTFGDRGLDTTAAVLEGNAPSRGLFQKLGFEVLNSICWFKKEAINSDKKTYKFTS